MYSYVSSIFFSSSSASSSSLGSFFWAALIAAIYAFYSSISSTSSALGCIFFAYFLRYFRSCFARSIITSSRYSFSYSLCYASGYNISVKCSSVYSALRSNSFICWSFNCADPFSIKSKSALSWSDSPCFRNWAVAFLSAWSGFIPWFT